MPVDRITCTLIPGDGVYPELMNSVQTVLKAIGAPIDFETILFSEVQHSSSAQVEDVIKSINRNRICLMVVNYSKIIIEYKYFKTSLTPF